MARNSSPAASWKSCRSESMDYEIRSPTFAAMVRQRDAVKRLIGRCFSDPSVKKGINLWPLRVVAAANTRP